MLSVSDPRYCLAAGGASRAWDSGGGSMFLVPLSDLIARGACEGAAAFTGEYTILPCPGPVGFSDGAGMHMCCERASKGSSCCDIE